VNLWSFGDGQIRNALEMYAPLGWSDCSIMIELVKKLRKEKSKIINTTTKRKCEKGFMFQPRCISNTG